MSPQALARIARPLARIALIATLAIPAATQNTLPDADAITRAKTRVANDTTASEADRQLANQLYDEAASAVQSAEAWRAKADEYEALREGAPQRLEEIRAQLRQAENPAPALPLPRSLEDLEAELQRAQAALTAAAQLEQNLADESATRSGRRLVLAALTAAARRRSEELGRPPGNGAQESPLVAEARRIRATAQKAAAQAEVRALENEQASYEARRDLLVARRDLAGATRDRSADEVQRLQAALDQMRQERTRSRQREAQAALASSHAGLEPIAREVASLSNRLSEIAAARSQIAKQREAARQRSEELTATIANIESRIAVAGLTDSIGVQLRRIRADLPSARLVRTRARERSRVITEAQLEAIDFQDRLESIGDLDDRVRETVASLPGSDVPRTRLRREARSLLQAKESVLQDLIKQLDDYYLDELIDVDTTERTFEARSLEFAEFIDQRVLWIPSAEPLWRRPDSALARDWSWIASLDGWYLSIRSSSFSGFLLAAIPALLVLGLLVRSSRRLKNGLREWGERAAKASCTSFRPTLASLAATTALAVRNPIALWLVGWFVSTSAAVDSVAAHAGSTAITLAWAWFALNTTRRMLASDGLARLHFGWKQRTTDTLRTATRRLIRWGIPPAGVAMWLARSGADDGLIGRVSFVLAIAILTSVLARVLHPTHGVVTFDATRSKGLFIRARALWFVLGTGVSAALGVLSIVGYHYTALQLATRLVATIGLVFGLMVVNALVLRGLLITRRRLAIQQARERSAAREAAQGSEVPELQSAEAVTSVSAVSEQARQLLRGTIGFAIFAGVWLIWVKVLPAIGFLEGVPLWTEQVSVTEIVETPDGGSETQTNDRLVPVTLFDLLLAGIVVFFTWLASRSIPGFLSLTILKRLSVQEGERYAIATVTRYLILAIGLTLAFSTIGLGWSKVQWLIAAMGLGLGFGLQEIFANFISGLIILFERPVRAGDIVTVGDKEGRITQIRMRATTMLDWDRREVIIPNKEFITARVTNWTLSDQVSRLIVPVGIAYGSDTKLAREVIARVAKENPNVLADPPPQVVFRSFGDSSLVFELRVFVIYREAWLRAIDTLHDEIDQAFREAGIVIAFPQLDLHVQTPIPRSGLENPHAS